jgi:hypothetical protein
MNLLVPVKLPNEEYIIGQFGKAEERVSKTACCLHGHPYYSLKSKPYRVKLMESKLVAYGLVLKALSSCLKGGGILLAADLRRLARLRTPFGNSP